MYPCVVTKILVTHIANYYCGSRMRVFGIFDDDHCDADDVESPDTVGQQSRGHRQDSLILLGMRLPLDIRRNSNEERQNV